MTAKIVVACGSGVATSEMVAAKIKRMLEQENIDAELVAVEVSAVRDELDGACAYVSVVHTDETYDVPVINGAAFLTGMNIEQVFNELLEIVRAAQ